MKGQTGKSRRIVDQFLGNMGEPVSEEQSERATSDVLERLRAGDVGGFRAMAVSVPVRPAPSRVWVAIAAGVAAMIAGGLLQMTLVRFADADIVAKPSRGDLQIAGRSDVFSSSRIAAGDIVKTGMSGGVLSLLDGSQIEMGPRTELSVMRVTDGLRVRLASGTVLVSAAKQQNGHLYVETKDCLVSVVGTVFAVNAEETGSRVSVLEGEVHVQRGDLSQTLLAGQEVSTSPQLGPLSTEAGNGLVAPERLAVLQPQPPPAAPQNPPASPGVTVRGVVKQGTGAGIPDVTVTLCPAGATRVTLAPATSDRPEVNDWVGGRIIKNKTFFFALWDTARCNNASVTTDSSGRFQFSNLAAGEYTVVVEREGYFGPVANAAAGVSGQGGIFRYFNAWTTKSEARPGRPPGDSKTVTVDSQQAPQEISLTLTKAGVITGRVRDAEGRLVVNAQVRVIPATTQGAEAIPVATATTNDLGEYRAYWILPGEYRVVATPAPGRPLSETWFPRGATSAEGVAVTVREGEEVASIDILLRPAEPGAPLQPEPGEVRWRNR